MEKGITVYLNGIGYWFEDYEVLAELLDFNCNDTVHGEGNHIEYDD